VGNLYEKYAKPKIGVSMISDGKGGVIAVHPLEWFKTGEAQVDPRTGRTLLMNLEGFPLPALDSLMDSASVNAVLKRVWASDSEFRSCLLAPVVGRVDTLARSLQHSSGGFSIFSNVGRSVDTRAARSMRPSSRKSDTRAPRDAI
jgi:hypothetical protein